MLFVSLKKVSPLVFLMSFLLHTWLTMKQQFSHAQKKAALEVQNLNGINFTVYLIRKKKFEKPICLWPQTMY